MDNAAIKALQFLIVRTESEKKYRYEQMSLYFNSPDVMRSESLVETIDMITNDIMKLENKSALLYSILKQTTEQLNKKPVQEEEVDEEEE